MGRINSYKIELKFELRTNLRGYTSVNAENLGDFREFFGRKVLN